MTALNAQGERILNEMAASDLSWLESYWNDPFFRAAADAEREAVRAECHAAIDAGMASLNARQRARWEDEGC